MRTRLGVVASLAMAVLCAFAIRGYATTGNAKGVDASSRRAITAA